MERNNTVSLSVHKNNLEQRRRKQRRHTMKLSAKNMSHTDCVEGYFFISWNKQGAYQHRFHDPDGVIGRSNLAAFVEGSARRVVDELDRRDDDDQS